MEILSLTLGISAGVCFGTGVIYLFTGLRRPSRDRLQILFGLFALAYTGAIGTGAFVYKVASLDTFLLVSRWGGIFVVLTLVCLLWFVAEYTKVKPRFFLVALSSVLGLIIVITFFRPNFVHQDITGLIQFLLPWGEQITLLDATESIWEIFFFIAQMTLIGYLIYACVRQFFNQERRQALLLGIGLAFFLFALIFDMLFIDSSILNFIYLGDFAFIPLLFVMSLQLSNQVIQTEEELTDYRANLQHMVGERTKELSVLNIKLAKENQERLDVEKALRQSERTARALLDVPHESALLINPQGDILDINQIGAQRLGIREDTDAYGKNVFDLVEPSLRKLRRGKVNECLNSGQVVRWKDERSGIHLDNRIYPIYDEYGKIESIAIYSADISSRMRTEQELHRRISDLDMINRIAQNITTVPDLTEAMQIVSELINNHIYARYTHIIYLPKEDREHYNLLGYDRQDGPIQPYPLTLPLDSLPIAEQVLRNGESLIISDLTLFSDIQPVHKFLRAQAVQSILLVPLWVRKKVIGLVAISRDQTEAKFSQQDRNITELFASFIAGAIETERLFERTKAIAAAEERNRLARDLHDAVTQTIYSASLIAEVLPRIWERSPEEGKRNLSKLRQLVRGALAEMRTLLFALRPSALDAASLDILLRQLGDALTGRTRIPVISEIKIQKPPPNNIKQVFYRIAQETFNNIEKHSEATQVTLSLHDTPEEVILSIKDNGRGFNPKSQGAAGLGLSIMRERAENIFANLEVTSMPGQGTQVLLTWSYENISGNHDG